jgi:translation elongation factor P/translation initiation factor 5A
MSLPYFTADGKPCTLLETIISMVKKGKDGNKITLIKLYKATLENENGLM